MCCARWGPARQGLCPKLCDLQGSGLGAGVLVVDVLRQVRPRTPGFRGFRARGGRAGRGRAAPGAAPHARVQRVQGTRPACWPWTCCARCGPARQSSEGLGPGDGRAGRGRAAPGEAPHAKHSAAPVLHVWCAGSALEQRCSEQSLCDRLSITGLSSKSPGFGFLSPYLRMS